MAGSGLHIPATARTRPSGLTAVAETCLGPATLLEQGSVAMRRWVVTSQMVAVRLAATSVRPSGLNDRSGTLSPSTGLVQTGCGSDQSCSGTLGGATPE